MRRILTLTFLALGLAGGIAAADTPRERRIERRIEQRQAERRAERRVERIERFRDHRYRPTARYERFEYRRGFHFVSGQWTWNGYEWNWVPGHYVRNYR